MPPFPKLFSILHALWFALTTLTTGAAASPPHAAPDTLPLTLGPLVYAEHKVTAPDGETYDEFGYTVALSGDTALVGADGHQIGYHPDQGAGYVFMRDGTIWTQVGELTASDGYSFDEFGRSVALSGDTALVGAHYRNVGTNMNQGAVYFYDPLRNSLYAPLLLAP